MVRVVVVVFLAGCTFSTSLETDQPMGDGAPTVFCAAAGAMCEGDVLHECKGKDQPEMTRTCEWGCVATGVPHCGLVTPAGGAVDPTALTGTGLAVKSISGLVDSDTGEIEGHRAAGSSVISGIAFEVRAGVGIFRFADLTISGPLSVRGANAVAFVSLADISINASIDARGDCMGQNAGPGGALGGARGQSATGPGAGAGGTGSHDNSSGGGGGGHATVGAQGGKSSGTQNPAGGATFGDQAILQLRGGGGGGGGGAGTGGVGGGGGGAVQLLANGTIRIAAGKGINAGGCGGGGTTDDSGGGGGAGGTILIEAPNIAIPDMSGLAVNGGGGGGADTGAAGGNGLLSVNRASGGNGGTAGGGAGAAATGNASPGGNAKNSGGGGGAHGRIRMNTKPGTAPLLGTTAFCSPTIGPYATIGTANVQ